MLLGVDIGLKGGICLYDQKTTIPMPILKIETKPAVTVLDLKNGKKQFYKSGPNKDQAKTKIKTPAKFETILDVHEIHNIFSAYYQNDTGPHTVVFEQPGTSFGNAASSTATVNFNFGQLVAIATLAGCIVKTVPAHKWKKDLNLTKDKLQCVEEAEKLSGLSFRTPKGALRDGEAESYLIAHWYKTQQGK